MSTNMPSIDHVVLEIALKLLEGKKELQTQVKASCKALKGLAMISVFFFTLADIFVYLEISHNKCTNLYNKAVLQKRHTLQGRTNIYSLS